MKLSNLSVIFIIIIIPIILVVSYYVSLQIDTINMQTSYSTKQLNATKEAIEAFEINTVEWNEAFSKTADSKRRDIMASINTFITNFANALGVGGTVREDILGSIPAIACTLYDGYYIYSPSEIKEVVKDENGVTVFMTESLANNRTGATISGNYNLDKDKGKILYVPNDGTAQGTYTTSDGISQPFTLEPNNAKTVYSHILKPFTSYSARYVNGNTDIVVNYTLDNYITIYGTVNGVYQVKSGYLIDTNNIYYPNEENLTELVWYEGLKRPIEYPYIYDSDNTKVYFDGDIPFEVSATGERTNLSNIPSARYKKVIESGKIYYQALNSGRADYQVSKIDELSGNETLNTNVEKGQWYTYSNGILNYEKEGLSYNIKKDVSARNYYYESIAFSTWVQKNLNNIKIGDIREEQNAVEQYGNANDKIFVVNEKNDPESENSIFAMHKSKVIKQILISNLNQAITSYSRNSEKEFELPVLTETDWNQILRNVSIVTFVQGIPIGMKYYNNYTVATSTVNKEYVNPNEIYLSGNDEYYHKPYCQRLAGTNLIGYRNIDYVSKSYEIKDGEETETKSYYKHQNISNQACYYCLVQRDLFESAELNENELKEHEKAYKTALTRERYVSHEFK